MSALINSKDPFLHKLLQEGSLSRLIFDSLQKQGFGESTILSYVICAAQNAKDQAGLFIKLFLQIAKVYTQHPDLIEKYHVDVKHLADLTEKVQHDEPLTLTDFANISRFCLPFNLQEIVKRMHIAYQLQQA